SIHVRHMGNIVQDVLTGSFELIKRAPIVESAIAAWRQITLTEAEQQSFAEQALTLRYPEGSPITAEKALRVRRYDDNGSDLWHVFNRVQEAVSATNDRLLHTIKHMPQVAAVVVITANAKGFFRCNRRTFGITKCQGLFGKGLLFC